jgi:hypothetical protein
MVPDFNFWPDGVLVQPCGICHGIHPGGYPFHIEEWDGKKHRKSCGIACRSFLMPFVI